MAKPGLALLVNFVIWTLHSTRAWDAQALRSCQAGYIKNTIGVREANSFLGSTRTRTPEQQRCCDEHTCENSKAECTGHDMPIYIRETQCAPWCKDGYLASVEYHPSTRCHYTCNCIDVCMGKCRNGGTCHRHVSSYSCTCRPGFTGTDCEIDINECASNPCQNGATCSDLVNMYKCHCAPRFYGVNCDTHECHPTPADVVFVLDSSVSMSAEQFRKQLEFVAIFIDHVTVGPNDFQVSVVTFSFEARVEFYLDEYRDNVTLKDAVGKIQYRPGVTFTDKGLRKVDEVFSSGRGTARRPNGTIADRFVFLLTDGMSTDWKATNDTATWLKHRHEGYGLKLAVIGIGNEVSHLELLNIASDPSLVYSVQDFDSLYTVLKSLVHYTCDECRSSSVSDVALFVDVTAREQYNNIRVLTHLVSLIESLSGSDVSLTSYDVNITEIVGFHRNSDTTCSSTSVGTSRVKGCLDRFENVQIDIGRMMYNEALDETVVDITALMNYVESTAFSTARDNSKKIVIIFSNGNFNAVTPEIDAIKMKLLNKNITTVCIASGSNVNFEGLASLVTDAFDIYLAEDRSEFENLDVLKSYLSYSVCDLQGE